MHFSDSQKSTQNLFLHNHVTSKWNSSQNSWYHRKLLKTRDTIGNCQRPVFSLGVSQHMHENTPCENLSSIGCRSCEIIMEEKTSLSHEVVCFQMLDFVHSKSNSEVLKSNSWKITYFSKTTPLQREPFLTMFYTINLSPSLITK